MIEVIPAIDIIDACCVRLSQGNYSEKQVYSKDPLEMAKKFESFGFKKLHLVDLDGAKSGEIKNIKTLEKISNNTNLEIDFGGGIKSLEVAKDVINSGANYINLGSLAVKSPDITQTIIEELGAKKIILTTDVKNGTLAINGWQDSTDIELISFLKDYINKGITQVLCTDISKDGMLQGTNNTLYIDIMKNFPQLYLVASGGVSSLEDVIKLNEVNIPAVVIGKAIYENKISLKDLSDYAC